MVPLEARTGAKQINGAMVSSPVEWTGKLAFLHPWHGDIPPLTTNAIGALVRTAIDCNARAAARANDNP